MKIGITAASSHYGTAVIKHLLELGTDAKDIVALGRTPEKLAQFNEQGIEGRHFDYDADLTGLLDDIDRLLFIPTAATSGRVEENTRVIEAAEKDGVQELIYLSFIGATDFPDDPLTPDHAETEALLADSKMRTLSLRSGFYAENVLGAGEGYVAGGVFPSTAQDGKISVVGRDDLALAGAKLLLAEELPIGVMTFAGKAYTKAEIAQALSEAAGSEVKPLELSEEDYRATLMQFGMPAEVADVFTAVDVSTRGGALYSDSHELADVLGRDPKTFAELAKEWADNR